MRKKPAYRPQRFAVGTAEDTAFSPPKQQRVENSSGFDKFFLKLNPFSGAGSIGQQQKQLQKRQNSLDHSSEESVDGDYLMIKTEEDDMTTQEVHRLGPGAGLLTPDSSSLQNHQNLLGKKQIGLVGDRALVETKDDQNQLDEDDLLIGNEQGSREPPLFMSPQTAYRKYQKQQVPNGGKGKERRYIGAAMMSQDFSALTSASHRSPKALQAHFKQPVSNRHRKTATGVFNSRQVHYPADQLGSAASRLSSHNADSISQQPKSSRKPTQKQKRQFAELLNLEKLNMSKASHQGDKVTGARLSTGGLKKSATNSRPGSSLATGQINMQHSENVPESEQKEQRVNNISLYGSTNPKNVKIAKRRPELLSQQNMKNSGGPPTAQQPYSDDSSPYLAPGINLQRGTQQDTNFWRQQNQIVDDTHGVSWDEDLILNPTKGGLNHHQRTNALPTGGGHLTQSKRPQHLERPQQLQQQTMKPTTSSKDLMSVRMIRQFKMAQQTKRPGPMVKANESYPNELTEATLIKQSASQEELLYNQLVKQKRPARKQDVGGRQERYQQDLRSSKQKKCMGQLNQSLEDSAKGMPANSSLLDKSSMSQQAVLSDLQKRASSALDSQQNISHNTSHKVLKESRSHDKDTLLRRLVRPKKYAAKPTTTKQTKGSSTMRVLQATGVEHQAVRLAGDEDSPRSRRTDATGHHQENLQEVEEDQFADGKIPHANISSYNSHQSTNKLVFKQNVNKLTGHGAQNYNSSGSGTLLDETFVMSSANNIVFRQDLRNSKLQPYTVSDLPDENKLPDNAAFTEPQEIPVRAGKVNGQYEASNGVLSDRQSTKQPVAYSTAGKASVQRHSTQVQGHQGDKLHDDEQTPH